MKRSALAASLLLLTSVAATGCSGDDGPSIVVYNAQHEQLLEEIAPLFEEETGIEVQLRNGKDSELAAQLIQEGDASSADVFLTENSPAMSAVEKAGLFVELGDAATAPIPEQFRPTSNLWTGFVARSTVLFYNPDLVDETDLPESLLDLADPAYAGSVLVLPDGRRLPGHRRRGPRARGRGRHPRVAPGHQDQRHRLRRQQRGPRVGRRR